MAKYAFEFKLKVVKDYLKGILGYKLLAKKYSMLSESPIKTWIRFYKEDGEKALHRKRSKKVYPVQFKLDVLNFKKQTGASYADTASFFKMNNPAMSKKHQPKQKDQDKELSREQLL